MLDRPELSRQFLFDPRCLRQEVSYQITEAPGTIVVDPRQHFLYLVQPGGKAIRYGVGLGEDP